jgi:hypothetical protein
MANPYLAYALLKATYSEEVRNPADVIIPLIKRSLFKYGNNPVHDEVVQQKLMNNWGLVIPLNVIQYSFPRLASRGIIKLERNTRQYKMVNINYQDQPIMETERLARKKYYETVQRLNTVIVDLGVTNINGEDVLGGWLDSSALSFLGGAKPATSADSDDRIIQRIVTIALTAYDFSSNLEKDLTELCLGDSLYRAVKSLSEFTIDEIDASDVRQKMDKVDVYFDTPLLVRILGYARDELNKGAIKLLDMCKATGCRLRIFCITLRSCKGSFGVARKQLHIRGSEGTSLVTLSPSHWNITKSRQI